MEGPLAKLEKRRNLASNDFPQVMVEAEKASGMVSAHKDLGRCSLELLLYPLMFSLSSKVVCGF